jgi:cytochrome c
MRNTSISSKAISALTCLMVITPALAATANDDALAKARQEYDAAVKNHDVGLQNAKKIQLAALTAKAGNNNAAAGAASVQMPPLAKELNCIACHAIDHKLVGPAWQDVANKYTGKGVTRYTYKGKEYPLIEGLVMKVSQGGSGNWGTMPMPANDPSGVKKAKITELVKFEQSLAAR